MTLQAFRKVKFQGLPSLPSRGSSAQSYRSLGPPGSVTSSCADSDVSIATYNRAMIDRAEETWQRMLDTLDKVGLCLYTSDAARDGACVLSLPFHMCDAM